MNGLTSCWKLRNRWTMNKETENKKVDFFAPKHCQTENVQHVLFGICDDEDQSVKTQAYIDTDAEEKWVAIVKNESGKSLHFTAVDNCIDIRRENGDLENRCDALLTNDEHIVFVELKNQRTPGWVAHAVNEQLQTTIDYFRASHDLTRYRHKRAFVCNKRHPQFNVGHKELMNAFYQRNKIRLNIEQVITFK